LQARYHYERESPNDGMTCCLPSLGGSHVLRKDGLTGAGPLVPRAPRAAGS
jgi:hypothetical protein